MTLKPRFPGTLSAISNLRPQLQRRSFLVRDGFTILELMVVMAVIGILMAILLPAVQYARESGRRTQCLSNLSQLGKAIHGFESSRGYLPPVDGYSDGSINREPGSAHYRLLPWLEQSALYAQLDETSLEFTRIDSQRKDKPEETPLPIFKCPTDSSSFGLNNYAYSLGSKTHGSNPTELSGAFASSGEKSRPMLSSVTDGLSNTAAVCERLRGSGDDSVFDPDRDIFFSGAEQLIGLGPPEELIPICLAGTPLPGQFSAYHGRSWAYSTYEATWYNHVVTPNSPVPYCTSLSADKLQYQVGGAWRGIFEASSQHSASVNLLLLDGSVRTISNSIAEGVWRAIGSRAGGEAIGEF